MLTNLLVPYDLCVCDPISHPLYRGLAYCLIRYLIVNMLLGAFNKQKALKGSTSRFVDASSGLCEHEHESGEFC